MPQFDFSTYAGQIFWLFVSFIVLMIGMVGFILPRFQHIITRRDNHINQLESQLEQYESELKTMKERFAQELQDAQLQAQEHFVTTLDTIKKKHQDQIEILVQSNKKRFEQFEKEMSHLKNNVVDYAQKEIPTMQQQFFERFH